jgi:hypothetical protein
MGAFSVLRSEEGCECGPAAGESCFHGSFWTFLDSGDLDDRELAEMVEHDGPALRLRQLLERRNQICGRL